MARGLAAAATQGAAVLVCVALGGCGGGAASTPTHRPRSTASVTPPPATVAEGAAAAGIKLTRIGTFSSPTYVAQAPGDTRRLFVVEQGGRIRVVRAGQVLRTPFLDIASLVKSGGEQGLLSMAFAPDYARSGRFYVDYTDRNGDTRVVEYRRSARPDRADARSARLVLFQHQPKANHNGGQLQFGPDGLLYIGFGDGGAEGDPHGRIGNGQNLGTLLGKILRIDPRAAHGRPYSVPRDNPFVGRRGVRAEIYAYGLRNPWRFSFDRKTSAMIIADVGGDQAEEIDYRVRGTARGANFGWRAWEGNVRFDTSLHVRGDVKPVLEYSHHHGGCAVVGGYVARDPRLPSLRGRYVYGDYCLGQVETAHLTQHSSSTDVPTGLHVASLSAFGEDDAGRIYAVSLNGPVYRIDPR